MELSEKVTSLNNDDLLRLCRVLTCAQGDEMKIYHSRLGGPGHQNAKEGSMIQRGRETAPDERKGNMEIKVDEEKVQEAVNEHINRAVGNAISAYSVQSAISEKIANEVTCGAISVSIEQALNNINTVVLTNAISEQIQRAMMSAVSHIIYDGLCDVLIKMRNIPSYESEKREKARIEIMALLKKEK